MTNLTLGLLRTVGPPRLPALPLPTEKPTETPIKSCEVFGHEFDPVGFCWYCPVKVH